MKPLGSKHVEDVKSLINVLIWKASFRWIMLHNNTYCVVFFNYFENRKTFTGHKTLSNSFRNNFSFHFNVHGSVHRKNILIYIQQDATLHSLFYLETALHVAGGTTTHHHERKQLYLQHLAFVTP
jgi:hypothetical protein